MKMCINCLRQIDDRQTQCPHCGYIEGANPMDYCHLPPRTVLNGRYVLGRPLGSGGFGVTYVAWDNVLDIRVAIKEFMPGELARRTAGTHDVLVNSPSGELFTRGKRGFMEESMRLAQLGDIPGVVKIFDCFEANGTAYIVMEYLEGETLQHWLEVNGRMSCEMCVPIMISVLQALERVHAAGLMHRDIAPDNILLCSDGRIMLIDFGAARHMTTRHSRSLSTVLKIGYAPVEQYYRDGDQGAWTDVYAVGATMYHALTGVIPPDAFTRANNDTLEKPSVYADIPGNIEVAILNAMNVSVEKRTGSAAEFAAQLAGELKAVRVRERIRPQKIAVSGRTKAALVASAIAAVAVAVLLIIGVPQLILPKTEAKVPDGMSRVPAVQTLPMTEAETILSDSDLRLRVAELVYDDFFERDIVLYQNPDAGSVAFIGSMVDVTVSAPEQGVPVPDVSGYDAAAAQLALEDAGFVVVTGEEYSDIAAPGSIMFQSLAPGDTAKPGSVIEIIISLGPQNSTLDTAVEVTVPSVDGMTFENARQLMTQQGLYVVIGSTQFSDTVPAGQIISQTPAANEIAHQGDTITVVVSGGKQTAIVPDVRFLTEETARARITGNNLRVTVNYEESTSVAAGLVIRQSVPGTTALTPGDTVTIWVSTGYQVTVPDCVGKTQAQAADALNASRLSYTFTSQNSTTVPEGQIISQSVAPGASVEQGTTITLVVSSGNRTVAVTGVTLSQTSLTLNIGGSSTLAATVKPADATTSAVTWSSADPGVAQVSASGIVTGRGAGTTTITVTTVDGAKTAACTVTVNRTLSSVSIISQPTKTVYYLGDSFDRSGLSVRANYNDGTSADITGSCTLSGFNSSSAGTKTVTAGYSEGGITRSGSFQITVSAPDVVIAPMSVSMNVGDTEYISYTYIPNNGSVSFSSSNNSVAKVSNDGTVTAVGKGSAAITATVSYNGYTSSEKCQVTVSEASVTLSQTIAQMNAGDQLQLTATVSPEGTPVTWNSSSTAVAEVSNGTVTAKGAGSATITAAISYGGKNYSATCEVTVSASATDPSMFSYEVENGSAVITGYTGAEANVTIPSQIDGYTVREIGRNAFYERESLTSVTIPQGVTSIDDQAFSNCHSLTSVTLPNSVTSIGNYAFEYCTGLTSITIPNSVTSIYTGAFFNCTGLTSITIPNSVTSIGDHAFDFCTNLTSITMSKNVTYIDNATFQCCRNLTSVTLPYGITGISDFAFYGCEKLNLINIPDSVTSIGWCAFYDCNSLTSITIPNGVTSIGSDAFKGCSGLTSITIPDSVTSIEGYAFEHCDGLTSIAIPDSVTSIGTNAFRYCDNLTIYCNPGSAAYTYAVESGIPTAPYDQFPG
ncbi:MAG: PASTA domain-containing protein [Ruminococcaceae bacterium]|nr:PASTA domain-containing protein [Oscillospiraceae bacterium]